MRFRFIFPVDTKNPTNGPHGHYRAAAGVRKRVRSAVHAMATADMRGRMADHLPLIEITYSRYSARHMDDDNLRSALKPVRDGLCQALGFENDNSPLVRHVYRQEKGPSLDPKVAVDVDVRCVACNFQAKAMDETEINGLVDRLTAAIDAINVLLKLPGEG